MHKENITSETLASQESKSIDECVTKEVNVVNPYIGVVAVLRTDLAQVQEYSRKTMVLKDTIMTSYKRNKMETVEHFPELRVLLEDQKSLEIDNIHMTFELSEYIGHRTSFITKTRDHVARMAQLIYENSDSGSKITLPAYETRLKTDIDTLQKQMGNLIDIIGGTNIDIQ
jgi:hypothetical protein